MRRTELIGCTTTGQSVLFTGDVDTMLTNVPSGAAKLVSLLNVGFLFCGSEGRLTVRVQAISPKVLMVEEAGQVLESHILASLVPSGKQDVKHADALVLIEGHLPTHSAAFDRDRRPATVAPDVSNLS